MSKLLDFVLERQNPYSVTVNVRVPLHNIITKLAVDRNVATRLLAFHKNGERRYRAYRRLVEKNKKISMTISKSRLPRLTDQSPMASSTIEKEKTDLSSKDIADAQRNIDIAKERGMDLRQILAHNMLSGSSLFDGDLPAHTNKSKLAGEIEHRLINAEWSEECTLSTRVVVDFMSKMRQMPLAKFPNLGSVIDAIISSVSGICKSIQCIHLVLDSYIEMSLMEGERMRRTESSTAINIIGMNRETSISQNLDKFWAS